MESATRSLPTPALPLQIRNSESYLWVLPLLTIFLIWEISVRSGIVSSSRLPLLSQVFNTLLSSLGDVSFVSRVVQSFLNLSMGILLALLFGLPMAVAVGLSKRLDNAATPLIMFVGSLPDLAVLPVMVAWFGPGNAAAILMAAVTAFFPLYFTVREGTKDIPSDLFHVTSVFKAGRIRMLLGLVLPAVSPQLLTGLRLAYDFVWEIVLAIELITHVAGIGTVIDASMTAGSLDAAFAAITAVGALSIVTDRLGFGTLEGWMRRWID